jgi:hypothetical protein
MNTDPLTWVTVPKLAYKPVRRFVIVIETSQTCTGSIYNLTIPSEIKDHFLCPAHLLQPYSHKSNIYLIHTSIKYLLSTQDYQMASSYSSRSSMDKKLIRNK